MEYKYYRVSYKISGDYKFFRTWATSIAHAERKLLSAEGHDNFCVCTVSEAK